MQDFHTVIEEFSILTSKFGFKKPMKLWYPNLIALSKHVEDIYYCYIIARLYKHDGALETTLWVGPIDRPDDGLDSLSANIKIQVGYTQKLDEIFFRNCESKIINLIEAGILETLVIASRKELSHPSKRNLRYDVYTQHLLPLFLNVRNSPWADKSTIKDKKKCQSLIDKELNVLKPDDKLFFDKLGLKATRDMIWELCYIHWL